MSHPVLNTQKGAINCRYYFHYCYIYSINYKYALWDSYPLVHKNITKDFSGHLFQGGKQANALA